MSTYEKIEQALKGHDSKNSCSFSQLQSKTGMHQTILNQLLNEMYEMGMIGRAKITRMGLQELHIWPTGVARPYNIHTDFKISPPRRDEIKTINTGAALQAVNAAKTQSKDKPTMTKKPRTLQILEHIETHPNCPYSDFIKILKIDGASAFLGNHIDRGDVIKTKVGPRKYNYSLKAGKTAAEIYNGGQRMNVRGPGKKSKIQLVEGNGVQRNTPLSKAQFSLTPEATFNEVTEQLDAEFCIERLLRALPDSYEITISKRDKIIIEINGGQLNDVISVPLNKINDTLEVLNKLNELIAA
jgi:hypothetical protein